VDWIHLPEARDRWLTVVNTSNEPLGSTLRQNISRLAELITGLSSTLFPGVSKLIYI
jgi:hypothetical protein